MSRQPKQVHIYLYRKGKRGYEYAIFQRSDLTVCWQGICGGLEDGEDFIQGARREIFEESGIAEKLPLYQLETVSYLPSNIFSIQAQKVWGNDIVVIPMYYYAMEYDGEIKLSDEHLEVKWLNYDDACELIYFDDQETALYELDERLKRNKLDKLRID
ncbi:MAG: NUDIX domain-containing protein [Clostridia bacterium]|nr:NUDIX domain-containing protein [Clostridia bacterium]